MKRNKGKQRSGRKSAKQGNPQLAPVSVRPLEDKPETGQSNEADAGQFALAFEAAEEPVETTVGRNIEMAEPSVGDARPTGRETDQTMPQDIGEGAFGPQLRAARERSGLTREDVAARLKLPLRLVARLEGDDFTGLDHGVFLRGYLTSYADLVGLPRNLAERVAGRCQIEPAPLVATGTISRSRYLFDRYSVSATYLILTALIVAPAVWLATHGGLEQNLAHTAPLDTPANSVVEPATVQRDPATGIDSGVDGSSLEAPIPFIPSGPEPIVASMAPFSMSASSAHAPTPRADSKHELTMKLRQASWIEVVTADGKKLEYDLLPAGSERTYHSDQPLSVRIGNTLGAEVGADGRAVDLAPFSHANVASFTLFGKHAGATASDNF